MVEHLLAKERVGVRISSSAFMCLLLSLHRDCNFFISLWSSCYFVFALSFLLANILIFSFIPADYLLSGTFIAALLCFYVDFIHIVLWCFPSFFASRLRLSECLIPPSGRIILSHVGFCGFRLPHVAYVFSHLLNFRR